MTTVDTSGFTAMCRGLAKISGKDLRVPVRSETGKVLETCVKWTKAAKASAYPRNFKGTQKEGEWKLHVNTGQKGPEGRVWLSGPGKKDPVYTHFIMGGPGMLRRWSDEKWARAQRMLLAAEQAKAKEDSPAKKKKRKGPKLTGRGLAKASWVQIAAKLGLSLSGIPSYVLKAVPQDGLRRESGFGREVVNGNSFFITIENIYPILVSGGHKPSAGTLGAKILSRAIKSRVTHFTRAVKKGWIDDMKFRASHFPGVFINGNS